MSHLFSKTSKTKVTARNVPNLSSRQRKQTEACNSGALSLNEAKTGGGKERLSLAPGSVEIASYNTERNGIGARGKTKPKLALASATDDDEAVASNNFRNIRTFDATPGAVAMPRSESASMIHGAESLGAIAVSDSRVANGVSQVAQHQAEPLLAAEAVDHDEEVAAAYEKGAKAALDETEELRQQVRKLQQREVAGVAIPVSVDSNDEERSRGFPFKILLFATLVIGGIVAAVVLGTQSNDDPVTPIETATPTVPASSSPSSTPEFFIQQLGQQLNGSPGDNFGSSISLSNDGRILAVGAIDVGSTGYVNIYRLNGAAWTLLKQFTGDHTGDMFGHSVSLSGDGMTLAIGIPGPGADIFNARRGRVKVFDVGTDETWEAIGNELFGTQRDGGRYFGFSVSLSEDGKMLAVGEPGSNGAYQLEDDGQVTIYELTNGFWRSIGSPIVAEECCFQLGWAVELRGESPIRVATSEGGQVFELVEGDWQSIRHSLGHHEPGATSLSHDGNVVAFSGLNRSSEFDPWSTESPYHPGVVSVYRYSRGANWTEMGQIEVGDVTRAPAVSLSPDGGVLAVGNPVVDSVGRVFLFFYENSTNTWIPFAEGDISGRKNGGQFGSTVALVGKRDSFTVAIGSSFASTFHGAPGSVAVYKRNFGILPTNTFEPTAAPTGAEIAFQEVWKWYGDIDAEGFATGVTGNALSLSEDGRVLAQSYVDGTQTVVEVFEDQSWGNSPIWTSIGALTSPDTGAKFALSGDGRVLALCDNIPSDVENATVSVFKYAGRGRWNEYGAYINSAGSDILEEVNYLALSQNGTTLAVGALLPSSWDDEPIVYRMESGEWAQILQLEEDYNRSSVGQIEHYTRVSSLSLSCDGNRIAIGNSRPEAFGDDTGIAEVFEYMDGEWQRLGQTLVGEARKVYFGNRISLSCDGTTVAVGSLSNDNDNGRDVGHVRVYQYAEMTNWTQMGMPLVADEKEDSFGDSFSLSPDGRKLAIGAAAGGYVKVYEYDDANTYWRQVGATLEDDLSGSGFGRIVSLADTDEGVKLAVGAPFYVISASVLTGRIRLFQEQENDWNGTTSPTETPRLSVNIDFPLQSCEGDCDSDTDCNRGLLCYQRSSGEPVPGCSDGENDESNTDYCIECQDVPGWLDDEDVDRGNSCTWYHENDAPGCQYWGSQVGRFGLTAKEACCHCKSWDCGDIPDWSFSTYCTTRDCGDAPDEWTELSCDWYEQFDEVGCPNYGDDWGIAYERTPNGVYSTGISAKDACCHCRTY